MPNSHCENLPSANALLCTHEGYLSAVNLYIMPEICRKLVIVGGDSSGKVSITYFLSQAQLYMRGRGLRCSKGLC